MTTVQRERVEETLRRNRSAVRQAERRSRDYATGAERSNRAIEWALAELRRTGITFNRRPQ